MITGKIGFGEILAVKPAEDTRKELKVRFNVFDSLRVNDFYF
jgi:hypothetical protein